MDDHLHIVSFNVPLPANYGGVIDMFYRLKALAEAGVKIHLHCFTYGRQPQPELNDYCVEVNYYRRSRSVLKFIDRRPFIVSSRASEPLKQRLLADSHPILLEGLHCCDVLQDPRFRGRQVMVRAHNIETDYYRLLSNSEANLFRKCYLDIEARRLKTYEPIMTTAARVFAISQSDCKALSAMGCPNVSLVYGSHPYTEVLSKEGRGDFILYHGNLSVAENWRAALYLIRNVFSHVQFRCVIAGLKPPARLIREASQNSNIQLVANPSDADLRQLILDAHVNILVTGQPSGLKLKLLNALYNGRHCLVNSAMVQGTGLQALCSKADTAQQQVDNLNALFNRDFTAEDRHLRIAALEPYLTKTTIHPIVESLKEE